MIKTTFHIFSDSFKKDYHHPWQTGVPVSMSGSGFGVEIKFKGKNKKLIVTNAHVVCDDPFIQITKWNNDKANIPKKYKNSKFYYDFYYKNYVKKGKAYENNTT